MNDSLVIEIKCYHQRRNYETYYFETHVMPHSKLRDSLLVSVVTSSSLQDSQLIADSANPSMFEQVWIFNPVLAV